MEKGSKNYELSCVIACLQLLDFLSKTGIKFKSEVEREISKFNLKVGDNKYFCITRNHYFLIENHYFHPYNILLGIDPVFKKGENWGQEKGVYLKIVNCTRKDIKYELDKAYSIGKLKAVIFQDSLGIYQIAKKVLSGWLVSLNSCNDSYLYINSRGFSNVIHHILQTDSSPKILVFIR